MLIESVAVTNYKSFLDRQVFQFEPGFNLLVGSNNAGKTTVLDVIDMDPHSNEPHRSQRTIPEFGGQPPNFSEFEVTLRTHYCELRCLTGGTDVYMPVTFPDPLVVLSPESVTANANTFANDDAPIKLRVSFGNGSHTLSFETESIFSGRASGSQPNAHIRGVHLRYTTPGAQPQIAHGDFPVSTIIGGYFTPYRQRIYRFNAQRRPGTTCGTQGTSILDREAASLPYCINYLQTSDADGHRILCEWINRVFPSVRWVQAPPVHGNQQFQMRCLPLPPTSRREDLATPLSSMGTGIGNVIALLYVVLTSRAPQVIAIDEPNAFLHPRALRELLAILESEGRQHQFIITAHSADVLTAVNPRTVSLLDFDGVATSVKQVGIKDLHQLRSGLADLGIRITDLHAKDRVLWVEGQTEELVMPELLRWACPEVAAGTAVLRVERTGTFSTRGVRPDEIASIYKRLSTSSALVPPMVCILLDAESRNKAERQTIEKDSQGMLRFLDYRMLENYLLDPEAIAAALLELGVTSTPEQVESALCTALGVADLSGDVSEADGAAVLGIVFSALSNSVEEFRKTRDVQTIVSSLLDRNPNQLAPLRSCLRRAFGLA